MNLTYTKIFSLPMLFLMTASITSFSQTPDDVDSLFEKAEQFYDQSQNEKAVNTIFDATKMAETIGYEKGVTSGLGKLALQLSAEGEYAKSIEYLNKALSYKKYLAANPYAEFNLLMTVAENNHYLGVPLLAEVYYDKAETIINQISKPYLKKKSLVLLYFDAVFKTKNHDSLIQYYNKGLEILNDPQYVKEVKQKHGEEGLRNKKSGLYIMIGDEFRKKGNLIASRKYYDDAIHLVKESGNDFNTSYAYCGLADWFEAKGQLDSVVYYREKALALNGPLGLRATDLKVEYEHLSKLYAQLGNTKKEEEYKVLFKNLSDSLDKAVVSGRNMTILNLVKENEKKIERVNIKNTITILLVILLALLIIGTGYYLFVKHRKKTQRILLQNQETIAQKEEAIEQILEEQEQEREYLSKELETTQQIIIEKDREVELLEQKTQDAFEEVIEMAKENHPNFYTRFETVYPEFHNKLMAINPDLQNMELTLCAYIYLGFSNKEIATYTFKAIKTIEKRKTSLRKRLEMNSSEQLFSFLKSL